MRTVTLIAYALSSFLICSLSAPASGTTFNQNYGTFSGNSVIFSNVTESSTSETQSLFGAPRVFGDSLSFTPIAMGAYSRNGMYDVTNNKIDILISSLTNSAIDKISFTEKGDYTLIGTRATANTNASIMVPLTVEILKVNGQSITPILLRANMNFSSGGTFELPGEKGSGVAWDGSVLLDITSTLRASGYQGYATELSLSWENYLTSNSEIGTLSYIKTKEAGGTGVTILPPRIIPEPVTFVGVLIGLAGLATYIRKRTNIGG